MSAVYDEVLDALDSAPIKVIHRNELDGEDPSEVWFEGPAACVSWLSAWTGRSESAIRRNLAKLKNRRLVRGDIFLEGGRLVEFFTAQAADR